jgi:hypothetical protein
MYVGTFLSVFEVMAGLHSPNANACFGVQQAPVTGEVNYNLHAESRTVCCTDLGLVSHVRV